jgi:hypothetical protein
MNGGFTAWHRLTLTVRATIVKSFPDNLVATNCISINATSHYAHMGYVEK